MTLTVWFTRLPLPDVRHHGTW